MTGFRLTSFGAQASFAGVPERSIAEIGDARVVILGAPFDWGTTHRPGARFGPKAVREADYLDPNGERPHLDTGIDPLKVLRVVDVGDVPIIPGYVDESVDAIRHALVLDEPAREVADESLDRVLGAGYGIFAGADTQTAVLRFTPERARWVADEVWHSRQAGRIEADGSYVLELPYSQEPELVMDLLRYGAGVEVLAPVALRATVAQELAAAARQYGGSANAAAGS